MTLRVDLELRQVDTKAMGMEEGGGREEREFQAKKKGAVQVQCVLKEFVSIRQEARREVEADKGRWLADRGGALEAGLRNVNFCLSLPWGWCWGLGGREWLKKGGDRINTQD